MALDRLPALTSLRGVAAVMVVLYHLHGSPLPMTELFSQGYLWVDFFFILSGFVIARSYGAWFADGFEWRAFAAFIRARFARIYPLHFAILIALIAEELVRAWFVQHFNIAAQRSPFTEVRPLPDLASQMLMLQGIPFLGTLLWNSPAWSISAEFVAYLLFPVLLFCVRAMRGAALVFILICIATVPLIFARVPTETHYNFDLIRAVPEFALGIILCGLQINLSRLTIPVAVALVLSLHLGAYGAISVLLMAMLVISAAQVRGMFAWPILVWLGEISYSIYLTQFPILELGQKALKVVHISISPLLYDAIIFGIVLGVSACTWRFVERPAQNWLRTRVFQLVSPVRS